MNPSMTPSPPSHRRLDYHYMAMQAGFWAMFAAICAYQAALLGQRGFSSGQVGLIMAVRCVAGILCQPILGGFSDRHPQIPLKTIVAASLGLSLAASLALQFLPMGLGGTLAVFAVIGGFELSSYPLMDAMAIQYINAGVPIRYSLGRGMGSLAYAVCCVLLGLQAGRFGVESTLTTHALLVGLELVLVLTYPPFRGASLRPGAGDEQPHSIWYLLRQNPAFTLMLLALLLGMTGVLPLSNFLSSVVVAHGGGPEALGWALFLMGGFELPTAFLFARLHRRLGSARLLVLSMAFCLAKGAALLLAPSLGWVLLAQPLQMLGYGLFTPTSVYYVDESVPRADRVRGQTLMMVASNGLGGVFGNLCAGRALDLGGPPAMLLFCTVTCALALCLSLLAARWGRRISPERS